MHVVLNNAQDGGASHPRHARPRTNASAPVPARMEHAHDMHPFSGRDAEAVLGMRRLLVKLIGAAGIPPREGVQRSCSAEMQLITNGGGALGSSAVHMRTGPPNRVSTVKDTEPVWNAEYVSDLSDVADALSRGATFRIDLWDEAETPPIHIGETSVPGEDILSLCMRDVEQVLPLYRAPTARDAAATLAGAIRLRLAYVDVHAAIVNMQTASVGTEEQQALAEAQIRILTDAIREEEETVAFLCGGPVSATHGERQQKRNEVSQKHSQATTNALLDAMREEKRQALEAVLAMHNQSLDAFREDLNAQRTLQKTLQEEAVKVAQAEVEVKTSQLETLTKLAQSQAMETAERIIEQVEADTRAEIDALQKQQAEVLRALQRQLAEQLTRERAVMEQDVETRSMLAEAQVASLKQTHAQLIADLNASMAAAIDDCEQSALQVQVAAREEVAEATREHEAQLRAITEELEAVRRGEADERAARVINMVQRQAETVERQHEQEIAFIKDALKQRTEDHHATLLALGERLDERHHDLDRGWNREVEELKKDLTEKGLELQARHKIEITSLRSAYNDAIEKLKAKMIALVEERTVATETAKLEYEAQLISMKREHQAEQERMREDFEERERRAQMHMQRVLDSKVTAHERAMAELKEVTLLSLSEEQQSADGALPALEEKFQAATRAHERNAQDLVHSMEQKLAAQHELQSAEFAVLESRHEQALASAKKAWAEDMEQMKRQAEAREEALLERLREQGEEARLEAESAAKRAEEALRATERRAREAREQAVDECNTHWLGVVQQQAEAHAASIAAMQAAAAEQLEQEGRNVEQLELAQLKEVTEASARLREVQEALEAQKKEELEDAARRYEYLLKHTVSKLQQEMMGQLEQERRRWEHQLEEARTSAMDEQQRNLASQAESSRAAVRTAEARVLQLSELLEKERAEHLEALDSLRGESDRAHTQEVEEQHLWFGEQLQQFEQMRDDTLARLTDEVQRSFDAQRKAVKDELDQEREALTKVVATLRQEQTAAQEAVDAERARETAETKRLLRQTSTEWQQRLSEDQEQRARINQEDLKRLDELASQMRELLQHERNESIEREAQLRRQHEASVNEMRDTAYEQARTEHERVLREAALQATQTAQQAEQTLMAALSQKDEQIAASTLEYEAEIARMINEHSTLQEASRKALDQATEECREVREQLHSLQQVVEKQLLAAVEGMTEKQLDAIRQQQEKVAAIHKNSYNKGLEKMYEQQIESQRALTSMLDVIRQESVARHKRSAMGVAEAVEELRLRREQELGNIVAQHQTSIRQMRQQYEAQLERQATLAKEALEAQKAQAANPLSEIEHGYSRQISQPTTEMGATIQVQATDQYNLALPTSLKHAVEEGESELREAYAQEIRRLQEEHMAEVEAVLSELAEIKERAAAALSEQADLAAAREAALLSEARLEYERARNAEFEKLNAVRDSSIRNVREDAESLMDAERQHILAEERIKIEHENLELRDRVIELEHALQECEETRVQLSREAGLVHANEVARLQAELKEVRAAVAETVPKTVTSHKEQANSAQLPTAPRDEPPEPRPSAEAADVSCANAAPRDTPTRAIQPSKPAGSKLRVPDSADEVETDVHCSSHEPSSTNPRRKMIETPSKARPSKSSPGSKPRSPASELRAEVNEPTQRPATPSKVDGKPSRGKPQKSGSSEELPESAETTGGAGPSHDVTHARRLSKPVTGKPRKSVAIEHEHVSAPDVTRGAAPSAASLEELPDGEEPANGAGGSHDASHARRTTKSITGKPRKSFAMGKEDAGIADGTNGSVAQEVNEAVSAVRPAKPAGTAKPRVSGGRLQLRSGAPPR